ncbi:MAG TPA: immunity 22 family protein [Tepidisphaeraceae bacterium]
MQQVHVFVSTARFRSFDDMRAFIDKTYTEEGEGVPSPFMREVGLTGYEPGCIEAIHAGTPTPLSTLLSTASYADQWLPKVDGSQTADAAICVFAPNGVTRPSASSLQYVGAYDYQVR